MLISQGAEPGEMPVMCPVQSTVTIQGSGHCYYALVRSELPVISCLLGGGGCPLPRQPQRHSLSSRHRASFLPDGEYISAYIFEHALFPLFLLWLCKGGHIVNCVFPSRSMFLLLSLGLDSGRSKTKRGSFLLVRGVAAPHPPAPDPAQGANYTGDTAHWRRHHKDDQEREIMAKQKGHRTKPT